MQYRKNEIWPGIASSKNMEKGKTTQECAPKGCGTRGRWHRVVCLAVCVDECMFICLPGSAAYTAARLSGRPAVSCAAMSSLSIIRPAQPAGQAMRHTVLLISLLSVGAASWGCS